MWSDFSGWHGESKPMRIEHLEQVCMDLASKVARLEAQVILLERRLTDNG